MSLSTKQSLVGLSFVFPWIVGFLLLFLYPMVESFIISVGKITDFANMKIAFVGLTNFKKAFFEDAQFMPMFLNIVKTSLIYLPLITAFSFFIAMLLNKKMVGRGFFRVVFFLPVILGTGFIMQQLLSQRVDQSSIDAVRKFLLPNEVVMYFGPQVTNAIIFFIYQLTDILWRSGVQILIFLSGLQSISPTLYEAAKVDSANEWEKLCFITIPMMSPIILLNLVYTIVDSFTDSSNPIITYIMNYGFKWRQFEYAAAMGWIYLLFTLVLVLIVFFGMKRFTDSLGDK